MKRGGARLGGECRGSVERESMESVNREVECSLTVISIR